MSLLAVMTDGAAPAALDLALGGGPLGIAAPGDGAYSLALPLQPLGGPTTVLLELTLDDPTGTIAWPYLLVSP